jgi:hypothetical protein
MKEEVVTDALLREFLLGRVNDDERERIENLFLTDSVMRERVLSLEQDLIEEYLEDSLTEKDRGIFISRYARTEEQRSELRITKSIKDWARREALASQTPAATLSVWDRLAAHLKLKRVYVVPIAAVIVIAIILAIVWRNSQSERRKHLAVEQELAQLNSSESLGEVLPQMSSLDLRPVTGRSIEQATELKLRADIRVFELRLPWIGKERYSTYRAEIRRVNNKELFTIPNLPPENDAGNVIRLRLPAHMLSRGQYQIHLSGVFNDGSASTSEEYSFVVSE